MVIREQRLRSRTSTRHQIDYSSVPRTTMTWTILHPANREAHRGDKVSKLVVNVEIRNDTDKTFVFPNREVALAVVRNGRTFHELVTEGEDFQMAPGARLNARYDIPIAYDGEYSWRAKTWFYEKR
jgi:hypothetical protein